MFRSYSRVAGLSLVVAMIMAACSTEGPTSTDDSAPLIKHQNAVPGQYIVIFEQAALIQKGESLQSFSHDQRLDRVDDVANRMVQQITVPTHNIVNHFGTAVQGVVIKNLTDEQVNKLRQDPRVRHIEQDFVVTLPPLQRLCSASWKGQGQGWWWNKSFAGHSVGYQPHR